MAVDNLGIRGYTYIIWCDTTKYHVFQKLLVFDKDVDAYVHWDNYISYKIGMI